MTLSYRMEFEMLWIFTSRIFFTESTLFFVKTLILGLREVIYYIYFECNTSKQFSKSNLSLNIGLIIPFISVL